MATIIKDLGPVSAYAYAVTQGYTGTEEEFAELMADYADVGQRAEDAAESALSSKTAAQTAAQTATSKAAEASTSATSASGSASAASASASAASGSATQAAASATSASGSATAAAGSATTASTKASEASASATAAQTAQTAAEAAQTAAETAQGKAEDAQEAAEEAAESVSASAAQIATNTADIAQLKSEVSALPTDGMVANSKQLLSENGTDNTEPYMFRAVPVNADRAELDAVVGGTVAWNQLVQNGNFESTDGWNRGTVSNNEISFPVSVGDWTTTLSRGCSTIGGHKFLAIADVKTTISDYARFRYPNVSAQVTLPANVWATIGAILSITNNGTTIGLQFLGVTDAVYSVRNYMLFDLTQMFGSTIADYIYSLETATTGAGVAFFRKLFPKGYYPYDVGTLKSVEGVSSHDMVGFNQWDEEWEVGGWSTTTGTNIAVTDRIRSKNYIPVVPNTRYFINASYAASCCYDADKNFIGSTPYASPGISGMYYLNIPNNARYIKFNMAPSYGVTYKNDICINLSDPVKNGTYEPYVKHSYPLDSSLTLRGIPKLADGKLSYDGDRYLSDGTVERRYGIVDLGTFDWNYISASGQERFYSSGIKNLVKKPAANTDNANIISSAYDTFNVTHVLEKDKIIAIYTDGDVLIRDTSYTDAASLKTALSGVMLVYELATPTTETATPYQSLQICDPNGTEEFVTTGIVPVGHETRYPENLRAKIEGLPWDFSSLIAPTEKTTTASRNYTTGSLLIMGNVLYKVTANIANGGTITPNTNVTATTLSEVISALQ